jgi:hypothetical protein
MITLNNGVANVKATPAIIADSIGNLPLATSVAEGTLFIDLSSKNIVRSEGGSWATYAMGTASNLQDVLTSGNSATDLSIQLDNSLSAIRIYLTPDYIEWLDVNSAFPQYLYPSTSFNNQKVYLPAIDGILATTTGNFKATISTTPYTPNGANNENIYRVATGSSSLVLNPSVWIDKVTVTFCFDVAATFSTTGGATIKGTTVRAAGLSYVKYLQSFNTFYIN